MADDGMEFSDIIKFRDNLLRLQKEHDAFMESVAKEITAKLLKKVIERTPVGDYANLIGVTKVGGTLKQSWTSRKPVKEGDTFVSIVFNPITYGIYVEYGHRQTPGRFVPALGKRLKKSWVQGHFMITKSELEVKEEIPGIIKRKMQTFYGGMFDV